MGGLLVAQFFGAFNDNAFKMLVALLAIAAAEAAGDSSEATYQGVTMMVFVVFTLPLVLFSLPAMVFADRVSKRDLIVWMKVLELALMIGGIAALAAAPAGAAPLWILAGMGAQSALFSPGKYGIVPELMPHEKLAAANGMLEMASFVAIVLGTIAGGLLVAGTGGIHGLPGIAGIVLTVLSAIGLMASLRIPPTPAAALRDGVWTTMHGAWRALRGDRALWLACLGSVAYWGLASMLGQDVLVYSKRVLGLGDETSGVPMAMFAIGVGGGAVLAGRISRGKVETGLVPLGALGLAIGSGWLGIQGPGMFGTLILMTLLGVASGFVLVPLNALIQWRAPAARRGAVIAMINALSYLGILVGNLACTALAQAGADTRGILVIAAGGILLATAWAIWLLPEALLRLCLVLAANTLFRLRVVGVTNVPQHGGALLVPNHVSFLDALFLIASTDRRIRFVIDQHWYERPLLKPFLRAMGAIPITATGGPRVVLRALRDAGRALDEGEVVCIFAEGEISRMGSTLPFRRGMQRMLKGRTVPIVPAHLDGAYGGFLSPRGGRVRWLPHRVPMPITVSFGAPLPADTEPAEVRRAVDELAQPAFDQRRSYLRPLHHALRRRMRRRPFGLAFADATGRRVSRLAGLAGAVALARRLRGEWRDQQRVGILLPPSIGGALTTIAASLSGRTAVALNYTVGPLALASAVQQAGLRTVVTSRAFLDRLPIRLPDDVRTILLEDVMAGVTRGQRLGAALAALFLPMRMLERLAGAQRRVGLDDEAAVIFSSGSTGDPKGIVLSHYNVQANCDAVAQVLPLAGNDGMLGVLPLFHSFGNMALWYAAQQGASVVFHANPLDAAAVGELVARYRLTVLIATPTFLQLYLRRCEPGQFGSLRLVLTGAEKLTDTLADTFADRFGIRPVQGYGCTECSPVVAVATPGFRAAGFYQAGTRRGSVGRPLPGVVVRVVDPESKDLVPVGQPGLVLVAGPNVMQGYLGRPDLTAAAMCGGAYVTGDIGRVDEEGFLYLTDRLSRFSKIGGEMVPHGVVEEHLQSASGRSERVFAVCGVPDPRKGERLAVLTTLAGDELPELLRELGSRGLPALFVPKPDQFVIVAELPLLGTGKLDLKKVKEMALAGMGSE